jgi:hypothetical protein
MRTRRGEETRVDSERMGASRGPEMRDSEPSAPTVQRHDSSSYIGKSGQEESTRDEKRKLTTGHLPAPARGIR